jgi:CRISPR/Cas system-associated protein Cas5 (RAMP superfamily)
LYNWKRLGGNKFRGKVDTKTKDFGQSASEQDDIFLFSFSVDLAKEIMPTSASMETILKPGWFVQKL